MRMARMINIMDEYGEDIAAALDLVTQVHSERMTTIRMGRVRVLVRKKEPSIRKQQIVKKSIHVILNCQNQTNNQFTACE